MDKKSDAKIKKDLVPDWSNIDATSFYRSGGATEEKATPKDFEKLTKETNRFLVYVVVAIVIIFVIAILTKP